MDLRKKAKYSTEVTKLSLKPIKLRMVNHKKGRYYTFCVYEDLLGDLILLQVWGGLKNRLGAYKKTVVENINDALIKLEQLKAVRIKRGYS